MKGKPIVGVPRHIYSLRVHVHLGTYNVCAYVCNTLIDREDFDETPRICERNSIIKATCTIFIPYLPASESSRNDSHRHKSKAGSFSSEEAASWECLCLSI